MKKVISILLVIALEISSIPVPVASAQQIAPQATHAAQETTTSVMNVLASVLPASPLKLIPVSSVVTQPPSVAPIKKHLGRIAFKKNTRHDFQATEEITLAIDNPDQDQFSTKVVDGDGKIVPALINIDPNGTTTDIAIDPPKAFKPGKYSVTIIDSNGKKTQQDFTWGVLALNTDKAIYKPGESADIAMAVLDEKGKMVCDAKVELRIKNQESGTEDALSTENGTITVNHECQSHSFTLKPDYEARYQWGNKGTYELTLSAQTKNGTYTIASTLSVQDDIKFDIKRTSATRIYPPHEYPMNFSVTANQDFEGTITETVPESFTITPSSTTSASYTTAQTLYLNKKKDPGVVLEKKVLGASTSALLLPFSGSYKITQGFGVDITDASLRNFYTGYGLAGHDGVDFGLPVGTPLFAVDEGNVVWAGPGDYGVTVIIQHSWGKSYYGHLSLVTVENGFHIQKGGQIGYSGNSGESTGPHLHFGIKPENPDMNNGYMGKVDPLPYFNLPDSATSATDDLTTTIDHAVLGASTSAEQSFTVLNERIRQEVQDANTKEQEKVKVINWQVSLKKGETTTLSYTYKAPQVSPQFYLVGPLHFYDKNSALVFEEGRQWQIAADDVGDRWYDYSWQHRKKIAIDYTQVGATPPTFDVGSTTTVAPGSTASWSHTTANQSNRIMIVAATIIDSTIDTISSATYNGVSLAPVPGAARNCSSGCRSELWYLLNPATGTHTVQVNLSGTASPGMVVSAATLYNVDQTTPLGTAATNIATGSSVSVDVTSTTVSETIIDNPATNASSAILTQNSGQTKYGNNSSYKPAINGTTNVGWSANQSGNMAEVAVPVRGISPNQSNFPILINLSSDTDLSARAQNNGNDILFTSSDGQTKLSHEIESYTQGTGALIARVNVLSLSASANTDLYMYYGNPSAPNQEDVANVWDVNYKSVWHLDESGNGTAGEYIDSTSTANNGRGGNGTAADVPVQSTGQIGNAQNFDGSTDKISTTNTSLFDAGLAYTLEAWINADTCGEGGFGDILSKLQTNRLELYMCELTNDVGLWYGTNAGYSTANSITLNTWQHVAVTHNGSGTVTFYINGNEVTSDSGVTDSNATGAVVIGADATGTTGFTFDGDIDELSIASTSRTDDWINTEYHNQNSPSTFYTLGSEETKIYAPNNDELMRHGKWFCQSTSSPANPCTNNPGKQPFVF